MPDLKTAEIEIALQAVRQASLLIRRVQAELITPAIQKDDRSPVTVADFASQALVGKLLSEACPDDPLVAEEDSAALRAAGSAGTLERVTHFVRSYAPAADPEAVCAWIDHGGADGGERFWTLDPIDGTKGFLRGDQYVVALALVIAGQVQIGVLGCPNLVDARLSEAGSRGLLVFAARGQGAWSTSLEAPGDYARLGVSAQTDPRQARLLRSFESGHTNISQIDIFAQKLGIQAEPVRMDSQAKYALLAAGQGEIYLRLLSPSKPDYREKIWDQAAGALILEEAGGRITDLHGKPLDFSTGRTLANNRGILGSNGPLHDPALQALEAIGA